MGRTSWALQRTSPLHGNLPLRMGIPSPWASQPCGRLLPTGTSSPWASYACRHLLPMDAPSHGEDAWPPYGYLLPMGTSPLHEHPHGHQHLLPMGTPRDVSSPWTPLPRMGMSSLWASPPHGPPCPPPYAEVHGASPRAPPLLGGLPWAPPPTLAAGRSRERSRRPPRGVGWGGGAVSRQDPHSGWAPRQGCRAGAEGVVPQGCCGRWALTSRWMPGHSPRRGGPTSRLGWSTPRVPRPTPTSPTTAMAPTVWTTPPTRMVRDPRRPQKPQGSLSPHPRVPNTPLGTPHPCQTSSISWVEAPREGPPQTTSK